LSESPGPLNYSPKPANPWCSGNVMVIIMSTLIKIIALMELFEGEQMRKTPFISGYRPHFRFEGSSERFSGKIVLDNSKEFLPGTKKRVQVFFKRTLNVRLLQIGKPFTIDENGIIILGEGEILEIFLDQLI
jgi:hypothetical protein